MLKPAALIDSENGHVAKQYENWVYPFPIMDLSTPESRRKKDGGDFAVNFHTYWPDQSPREDIDVLVAGCGSNAAARYAFNHPQARVTGIDLSSASLAHEAYLKDKHQLSNLTLHQGRLEDITSFGKEYDFIDVSGVLHHLPDPVSGLRALGSALKPHGTIAIMVYGQYGRTGVYMMQELFRLMGLQQNEQGVAMVKQTLGALPKDHIVKNYVARTLDLKYDAGLVDTFLHQQDRAYTVAQSLDFVKQAGLSFMGWWDNIFYYGEGQLNIKHSFYETVNAMPEQSIWEFMELFNGTLGQHAFAACRSDRDERSYKISFEGDAFMRYIPSPRSQIVPNAAGMAPDCITLQRKPYPTYPLDAVTSALYLQMDGKKTIAECFAAAGIKDVDAVNACRTAFKYLWRLSYAFFQIPKA